jgi:glutamate dehydrogenase/leucine dehydrogenase
VGIIDRDGGIIREEGMGLREVKELFVNKDGNKLQAPGMLSFDEVNQKIWNVDHEIFIPAAASKIVTREQADSMIANGLEVISCGANVPFVDDRVFFGPTAEWVDRQVSMIPDFIANCGMARVFAYLMKNDAVLTDEAIFTDVSAVIRAALQEVHDTDPGTTAISARALKIALDKLLP